LGDIRIGTSGWSYPTGKGTWNGIFYPKPAGRGRGRGKVDELEFYAEHFDTVEVNSTFYRVPSVEAVRGWAKRTPPGFEFSLKLYQKFTHPAMFHEATGGDPWDLGAKDVDEFLRAIEPLADAGKLGALLAQFPPSFKNEPDSHGFLEWLLKRFREHLVAVELRLNLQPNVRTFYYLRLHGRNAAQWWKHDKSEDRYNYLYSPEELEPFAEAVEDASRKVRKAYLYTNNHFSAKSVANAAILKHKIGLPVPGEYPEEMVERYPELQGIVKLLPPPLIPSRKP
jgi:uncharacterized protein YecE (DUF72 family)